MNPEEAIAIWSGASRWDVSYKDVEHVLLACGFEYVRKTDHTHMWKCDDLRDHPKFRFGRIQISDHFGGRQGSVAPDKAKEVAKAMRWVIDTREERRKRSEDK